MKERVQVFGHVCQGPSGFLRPLRNIRLSLQVLSSTQDLLALYEVLVGVTEREVDIVDLWTHEAEGLKHVKKQVPPFPVGQINKQRALLTGNLRYYST